MNTTVTTGTATSADGTTIAFESSGTGPVLVLVDGALCSRSFGPSRATARLLSDDFRVVTYDRRGRGESSTTAPYSPDREVEDLDAVIGASGGSAHLLGFSSGAALALDAAARLPHVTAVAGYEPPLVVTPEGNVLPSDFIARLQRCIDDGRPDEAVQMFMRHVGTPRPAIAVLRLLPLWRRLKDAAHTLPYDLTILGDTQQGRPLPRDRWQHLSAPTLMTNGSKAPEWLAAGVRSLAELVGATYQVLPGQTHNVKPAAIGGVVTEFFRQHARSQA